jgi:primosomal replication protein N
MGGQKPSRKSSRLKWATLPFPVTGSSHGECTRQKTKGKIFDLQGFFQMPHTATIVLGGGCFWCTESTCFL